MGPNVMEGIGEDCVRPEVRYDPIRGDLLKKSGIKYLTVE